jgi:hypothetical protein
MAWTKFFRFAFGVTGDRTAVPDDTQPSGDVSFEQGYGVDYSRDPATDPLAKNIERAKMNALLYDVTSVLQQYQTTGVPLFITAAENDGVAYEYEINAQVRYDGGSGFKTYRSLEDANVALPTDATKWEDLTASSGPVGTFTNCRLTKSGANLLLSRFAGTLLSIDGNAETIPSGGVTLAATGVTVGADRYIYAYMATGVMTLEASATAWAVDATSGMPVKSGDPTRTLVGMARAITGPAWQDDEKQRFVRSYWNDQGVRGHSAFTAQRSVANATPAEIDTEIRIEFLTWGEEIPHFEIQGTTRANSAGGQVFSQMAIDGATVDCKTTSRIEGTASFGGSFTLWNPLRLSEGYHYLTLFGASDSGAITAIWDGGATSTQTRTVSNMWAKR